MEKRKTMDITIGTNMSKLRKQFNLTQKEICSVVGVNTSTYKHYELGDRMVPISVLKDLAKFYKVSTNYFFENMPTYRPIQRLSENFAESLRMMSDIQKLRDVLPGIDCGACGAPTCRAFAEDVVRGNVRRDGCPVEKSKRLDEQEKKGEQ